jgi:hypothetical protein
MSWWSLGGRKRHAEPPPLPWDLSMPVLDWDHPSTPASALSAKRASNDRFTLGHAVEGVLALGTTGSGKTTGIGAALALAYLRMGFGGLVLCAKPSEADLWHRYCEQAGRGADLCVFDAAGTYSLNFLDYELNRPGDGKGHTENLVELLLTVLEAAKRGATSGGPGGGREDEGFWRDTAEQLLRNLFDLLILAGEPLSVPAVYRVLASAPRSADEVMDGAWQTKSYCFQCMEKALRSARAGNRPEDYELVEAYFLRQFPTLSEKTRSIVEASLTSTFDVLQRGIYRPLFSAVTNLTPDDCLKGKVVVVALDAMEHGKVGLFTNVLWKTLFQRCALRRSLRSNWRPVFLWADEAHLFLTAEDQKFQTVCRGSRVATVVLSQTISNFYAALGNGEQGKAQADSLFTNLVTKVLHANGDSVTNEWASKLLGDELRMMTNGSVSRGEEDWASALGFGGGERGGSTTGGWSEQYQPIVRPGEFLGLRTGGRQHDGRIDAVVFRTGAPFAATGRHFRVATFEQSALR